MKHAPLLCARARDNLNAVPIEAERRGEEACWVTRCWCTVAQTATLAVLDTAACFPPTWYY
ncbi:MAG: hypothetical protein ACK56F_17105, partial [bacterium]